MQSDIRENYALACLYTRLCITLENLSDEMMRYQHIESDLEQVLRMEDMLATAAFAANLFDLIAVRHDPRDISDLLNKAALSRLYANPAWLKHSYAENLIQAALGKLNSSARAILNRPPGERHNEPTDDGLPF